MSDEDLIYQIYNTLYDPNTWQETLATIAESLDSTHVFLLARNHASSQPIAFVESGFENNYFKQYQDYFYQHDIWTNSLIGHAENQFHASHKVCDDNTFLQSEIYNDFASPAKIRHSMGCLITNPSQGMVAEIGLMRGLDQPHYSDNLQSRANRLVKHIQQSITIAQHLQLQNIELHGFQQFLNSYKHAVFICNSKGRLAQYNSTTDHLLRTANLIKKDSAGNIAFIDGNAQKNFEKALSTKETINIQYSFSLAHTSGVSKVKIQPWIYAQPQTLGLHRQAAVMVEIKPIRQHIHLVLTDLIHHYGLTRAEAEVVQALCRGSTLQEIAHLRKASIHTIRQQVKFCLNKTTTRSQAELVSKVLMEHLD